MKSARDLIRGVMSNHQFGDTVSPPMTITVVQRPNWKEFVACYCSAYHWVHTVGIGKCFCGHKRSYKLSPLRVIHDCGEDICEACGKPADTKEVDYGIGTYEFWGAMGTHTDWQNVTDCCEASLVTNELASRQPGWFNESHICNTPV